MQFPFSLPYTFVTVAAIVTLYTFVYVVVILAAINVAVAITGVDVA